MPGFSWRLERTYQGDMSGTTAMGNRWISSAYDLQLQTYTSGTDSGIELVSSASARTQFSGNDTSGYTGPLTKRLYLTHLTTSPVYSLFNFDTQMSVTFHDFTVTPVSKRGRIASITTNQWTAAGKNPITYDYDDFDSNGKIYITTSNGQACQIELEYNGPAGQLTYAAIKKPIGGGSFTTLQSVEYTYKSISHSPDLGTAGDLVQIKRSVTVGSNSVVRYTQYRYDGSSRLKGVFGHHALQQIVDDSSSIATIEDILFEADAASVAGSAEVADYAGKWFTYYTADDAATSVDMSHWGTSVGSKNLTTELGLTDSWDETGYVKSERVGAAGCASCSSQDSLTYNYYYLLRSSASDDNAVRMAVVEDVCLSGGAPDSARRRTIYGLNSTGRLLRQAVSDAPYTGGTPSYWCMSRILTATADHTPEPYKRFLIVESRGPSAHAVNSSITLQKFLNPSAATNDSDTLRTKADALAGPTYVFTYALDRVLTKRVKRGRDGTLHYVVSMVLNGAYHPTKNYIFTSKSTTATTSNFSATDYVYWGLTQIPKKITTTLPAISTGENGSGVSSVIEEYFDKAGRRRWVKDGEGYVHYFSYSAFTGKIAYQAQDVDPSSLPAMASDADLVGTSDADANTNAPTRGTGLPTPVALQSKTIFDDQGRPVLEFAADGTRHATVYEATRTIRFPYLNGSGLPTMPAQVSVTDDSGRLIETYQVAANFTTIATAAPPTGGGTAYVPTGFSTQPTRANYVSWTRYHYDDNDRLAAVDRYHTIPTSGYGALSTNFYRSASLYDSQGRAAATVQTVSGAINDAVVQVNFQTLDFLGRVTDTQRWRETGFNVDLSDSACELVFTGVETTALGKPVASTVIYDGGGVGDGHVTASKTYHTQVSNISDEYTYTKYYRDFRGQLRGMERYFDNEGTGSPLTPIMVADLDWRGHATATAGYLTSPTWSTLTALEGDTAHAATSATNRVSLSLTSYDVLERAYQSDACTINTSTGAITGRHRTNNYYDNYDRVVASEDPHGTSTEYAYDGVGRQYQVRTVLALNSTKYSGGKFDYRTPDPSSAPPSSGAADGILELSHTEFDTTTGTATKQHSFECLHSATNGINFGANDYIRQTISNVYESYNNRLTRNINFGSGNGSSGNNYWQYSAVPTASPTSSSAYALVTKYEYDAATGQNDVVIDPKGIKTKTFSDRLGRRTAVAENFVDFTPPTSGIGGITDDTDRVTAFEYNGLGQTTKLTAYNGSGQAQETKYWYEDPFNAALATHTAYPDSSSTPSSGTDIVKVEYNFDGSVQARTDQRGVKIEFHYNPRRMIQAESVDLAGEISGQNVDDSVLAISRDYDNLGRPTLVTSHSSAETTPSSTNVVNQIKYTYNTDYGYLSKTEQDHSGTVEGGEPSVQYSHDTAITSDVFTNGLRMSTVTYPDGDVKAYGYGTDGGAHDRLGRVASIWETSTSGTQLTSYQYNGLGRLVETRLHTTTNIHQHADRNADEVYGVWDRFGRQVLAYWQQASGSATMLDRYTYGYDYASNRTYRANSVPTGAADVFDQTFTYDNLHRLSAVAQGTDTGDNGSINTKKFGQGWTLEQLGNWDGFTQDDNGDNTNDLVQNRDHNTVNETTNISETVGVNWADPTHDAAGNMTTMPDPKELDGGDYTATYDAWNRLVSLAQQEGTHTFEYDGLHRRVERTLGGTIRHFYWNENWQCLEERVGSATTADKQYVHHPYYIDALAVSYNSSATKHFFAHDANFNVTTVFDSSGSVVERYHYTPYGEVTYLEADFDTASTQASTIGNEFLYTGRRLDPTGLYQYRYRYYHAQLGRFVGRDPIGYIDGLSSYLFVGSNPTGDVDPSGLKRCAAVRRTESNSPWETSLWKFKIKITPESVFEGRECQVDCGNCTKGIELTGTFTARYKVKVSAPIAYVQVGPGQLPITFVGSGEGGFKAFSQYSSCTGDRDENGCGYIRFSGGIEVCSGLGFGGITLAEACVKGEGYWQKKWCEGEKSSSCWGMRASASFCTGWRKKSCREYILIDWNDCSDGDVGGG